MTTRKYSSRAQQTTLSSGINDSTTSMTVGSGANLMGGKTPATGETYTCVIDPDTALEEIVDISNYASGNTLTIARGIDGSSAVAHSAGAIVRHMVIGRDLTEANTHIENATTAHGLTIANVVTTASSGVVTSAMITNDTIVNADVNSTAAIAYSKLNLSGGIVSADIANDTIVDADINTAAAIAWTKIAPSSTISATELGYLDGVTSAIQTQLDAKLATATASSTYAPLVSPALTGVPTAPTAAANTNTTQVATTAFVQTELTDLIGGAPGTLDTLNELATALGNDPNYTTTITTALGTKLPLAGGTMSGAIAMGTNKITGLGTPTVNTDAATKAYADSIVATAPGNLTGPITSVGAATAIASQTGTGTKFVMDTSPTLVTPVLGVATATSINGSPIPNTKTLVVTTDKISALAATTSAELAGVISDETGSGALVFGTAPTLASPVVTGLTLNDASIIFEGATADAFETTLAVVDPTADRTITLPDKTGTVALTDTVDGYSTTATAAGTTTLTVASMFQQFFTGATTQTVVMPVASTLYVGWKIRVVNNSSGIVTVQSSGANTIYAVPAGGDVIFTCILASGTTAASWDYKNHIATAASSGLTLIQTQTLGAPAATVTFSTIAATYTHLKIIWSAECGSNFMKVRFNGISTATYYDEYITAYATSLAASEGLGATFMRCGLPQGLASGVIDIPNYKGTTFKKTMIAESGYRYGTASLETRRMAFFGTNDSASAITQIDITADANFVTGSTFSLYGVS